MNPSRDERIDKLAASYRDDFEPDVEAGLARLHDRLGRSTARQATVRKLPRRRTGRWLAAASVLLLLLAGSFYALSLNDRTTVFAANENLEVELPDGTAVTLQRGSTLSYPADYNETERAIELNGQAFFRVHHDPSRPFTAGTDDVELLVTGTQFNLRIKDSNLEVEVSEGSVELAYEDAKMPVAAKQCGLALAGKKPTTMPAPRLNRHAWRTGKLHFENAKLSDVLKTVSNNYGIRIEGVSDCDFPINGSFASLDHEEILSNLAKLGGGEVSPVADRPGCYSLSGFCAD